MMDMVLSNFMSSSPMTNSPFGWYFLFQEIWKQICKKCILILKKTASCALSESVMVIKNVQCFDSDPHLQAYFTGTSCSIEIISVHYAKKIYGLNEFR